MYSIQVNYLAIVIELVTAGANLRIKDKVCCCVSLFLWGGGEGGVAVFTCNSRSGIRS